MWRGNVWWVTFLTKKNRHFFVLNKTKTKQEQNKNTLAKLYREKILGENYDVEKS